MTTLSEGVNVANNVGIKEVAAHAGVSYKTVSRVSNGDSDVRDDTRRRVLESIKALGYRPNHSAQSLRRGSTRTIRMILYLRETHLRSERFQDEVIAAAIDRTSAVDYSLLLEIFRDQETPEQLARYGDSRSDGVVLLDGRSDSPIMPILEAAGVPTAILVNPNASHTAGSIDADFLGGARAITRHLLGLGHRRIAHIGDDMKLHSSRLRRDGYLEALREAGINPDPDLIEVSGYLRADGFRAAGILLERDPGITAFFCVNDLTALGVIEFARERGLSVPRDLSVTGYDDISLAQHATPPLTTIHIPWYEMAALAIDEVIAAATTGAGLSTRVFPVDLCIRATTASVCSGATGAVGFES